MPAPHRTFSYLFEDYKNQFFHEWWQKGTGKKRMLTTQESILFVLLIALPIVSVILFAVISAISPNNVLAALIAYVPMIAEIVLTVYTANYVEKQNKESLDKDSQQYYEEKIVPLYMRLRQQDYDNRLSLAWIIQGCQEIIDQGCGLEKILKSFGRYYVVCILPILSFCAVAMLEKISLREQCVTAILGVFLLLTIFAFGQMISPEIMEFASKRLRVAKELKEGAEYLLAQGDLEITEKPRAILKREAMSTIP